MTILMGIDSYIYEVENYSKNHPGEGILNVYLRNFNRKDATSLFERYHNTNESYDLLLQAKKNKFNLTESGIRFVCPFFFKRRIPKYFHFIEKTKVQEYVNNIFSDVKKNSFFIRSSFANNKNQLVIEYYLYETKKKHKKYLFKEKDNWYGNIYLNDKLYSYNEKDVEKLIKKIMNNLEPINFK